MDSIPYTATSIAIIARFIFMFLLYKNKSTNSLSLTFCILSISSSSMWIYYSINIKDLPMIVRSSTELALLGISAIYIIRNKIIQNRPHHSYHHSPVTTYRGLFASDANSSSLRSTASMFALLICGSGT